MDQPHFPTKGSRLQALDVNFGNSETRDMRTVERGVGFCVEPGVYLDKFGARSEIHVLVHPEKEPQATTPAQESILLLGSSQAHILLPIASCPYVHSYWSFQSG